MGVRCNSPRVLAAVLGALGLASVAGLLLLCVPTKDLEEPPDFKYGIVLDAGSSHTAMFVYKWPADKENDTGIVVEHSHCDQRDGISSHSADPPAAGKSLRTCLNQALEDVPEAKHAGTPLYLGATAGMRLLNLTDRKASELVLRQVTSTLQQYPFDFRGAKILSGEDEGVFGWVTVNYLLENFVKHNWFGKLIRPKKGTLGAMDLGGASTQITFQTSEVIESSATNEVTLRLYGESYKVYTHSFLCYGQDQILKRLLSKVLKAERHALNVNNPCWPKGYRTNFTMGSVYDSPCTADEKPTNYFPNAIVTMSSSGDATQCRGHVESLFQFTECPYSRCSFDKVFQPEVTGKFIAFSAFYHTVNFIQSDMKRPVATPNDLKDAAIDICNSTWSELLRKAPKQEERLHNYCSTATFIDVLLTKGYKFDSSTFSNIAFQKKAGDTSIGWALGYMLNLTNMIPAEEIRFRKGTEYGPWVGVIIIFVAIILVALVTIFCLMRSSKDSGMM